LWVSRLVADFQHWQAALAARHSNFYLAVWLFEPNFGESQLVTAVEDELGFYNHIFGDATGQPLPAAYLSLPGVGALRWTARAQLTGYWPDEFAELPAKQRARPFWEKVLATGERLMMVQTGWVWVGQAP